jgi:hypothetical protein
VNLPRATVGVLFAAAIVGSGCANEATTQSESALPASGSIDAHERSRRDRIRVSGVEGNPSESSFGTVQPDGTYCGVFCSENH